MKKIAVVAARGLGDGLLSLVLSHNLQIEGCAVTTFNTQLTQLTRWFPTHTLKPLPKVEEFEEIFSPFDLIIAADHSILSETTQFGEKLIVLKERGFDKSRTLVENLSKVSHKLFSFKSETKENGLSVPQGLKRRKVPERVIIHPMSTEILRNWPKKKFLILAEKLARRGFQPVIAMSALERKEWEKLPLSEKIAFPHFETLDETAGYIFESGYLIGNNSGLGHLASNLGIPTLSLFARESYARLWRPGWGENCVVTPYPFVMGAKLKHQTWKQLLTVGKVLRNFKKLAKKKWERQH